MRVLGIDPGPEDWAWAVYDTANGGKITSWGDRDTPCPSQGWCAHIAIEDIVTAWQQGKTVMQTCKMIGRLQAMFPDAIMIPRKEVAVVLGGSVRAGDREINAALNRLVPSFAAKRKGLNGHHRAAAAVAYVAVGKIQSAQTFAEIVGREGK